MFIICPSLSFCTLAYIEAPEELHLFVFSLLVSLEATTECNCCIQLSKIVSC